MMPTPANNTSARIVSNEKLSGKELQDFMNHNGISTKEFSEIFGVTIQAVNLWLTGKRDFSITNTRIVRLFMKYPQLIKEF